MKADLKAENEKDAPAFSTRSKTNETGSRPKEEYITPKGNVGRLADVDVKRPSSSSKVTLQDCISSMDVTGRCDDGSDDTMASKKIT